jgi:hypothetical protein
MVWRRLLAAFTSPSGHSTCKRYSCGKILKQQLEKKQQQQKQEQEEKQREKQQKKATAAAAEAAAKVGATAILTTTSRATAGRKINMQQNQRHHRIVVALWCGSARRKCRWRDTARFRPAKAIEPRCKGRVVESH